MIPTGILSHGGVFQQTAIGLLLTAISFFMMIRVALTGKACRAKIGP
jgi:hypothetical protein